MNSYPYFPGAVGRFGEWDPPLVLPSSPDHSSKLRGPSPNCPCVASRRVVNETKLNSWLDILDEVGFGPQPYLT
ncbi:hypothetical protein AVEN_49472-1, partial [Araneus ventricosus]